MIFTCRPHIGQEEIDAVVNTIKSGWLISGKECAKFEEEFAEYVGAKFAVSTASCTHALQLAYMTCIPEESEVYTTPLTFTATINSMIWANLKPRFVDVDEWGNMLPPPMYAKYVVPVHFGGRPIDWIPEPELTVIYDCAHAAGGVNIFGGRVGGYGKANAFSFHATKCMTSCQGGALTTDDPEVARRARYLRIHGMTKDAFARGEQKTPFYDVQEIGIKGNLVDPLAAMARVQLRKLKGMNLARSNNAAYYNLHLTKLPLELPPIIGGHTYHLYIVKLRNDLRAKRNEIVKKCSELGVELAVHVKPVYQMTAYRELLGNLDGSCPNAENFFERCLTIPNYPDMTQEDLEQVVRVLTTVLKEYA